jgi:hypothetical protein
MARKRRDRMEDNTPKINDRAKMLEVFELAYCVEMRKPWIREVTLPK